MDHSSDSDAIPPNLPRRPQLPKARCLRIPKYMYCFSSYRAARKIWIVQFRGGGAQMSQPYSHSADHDLSSELHPAPAIPGPSNIEVR